jgi:FAD/FMN-containing dehydrogenase
MPGPRRRDVLRLGAVAAATTAVAACTGSSGDSGGPTTLPRPSTPTTTAPAPTSATAAAAPDWAQLADQLHGDLVRPGNPGYDRARELFDPRFDHVRPRAVVYCATARDVATTVTFARDADLPLALRSGGHSYAGWSTGTGVVLDVSRISGVRVAGDTAEVGAGARLIDVYAGVAARGQALPAGSCPTVGVAGLTLGGGQGVLSRAWGLTCDNLIDVDLVTADATMVTADVRTEPDLFWACRGGGGGNFGVATRFRFRLRPAPQVTSWYLRWDYVHAADVLTGWQQWAVGSPRAMWSTCKLLTRPGEATPSAQVSGSWVGPTAGLGPAIAGLVDQVGHPTAGSSRATHTYLGAMLSFAGCSTVAAAQCSTPRTTFGAASHVLTAAAPARAVALAVEQVARRHRENHPRQAGVSFDVLGGAVTDLAAGDTAFPYRDALAVAQYTVGWPIAQRRSEVQRDLRWLHAFRDAMSRDVGNAAYVNYVDPTLPDWQQAYYGANYPRLQRVKQHYAPDDVFRFPQSVQPAG